MSPTPLRPYNRPDVVMKVWKFYELGYHIGTMAASHPVSNYNVTRHNQCAIRVDKPGPIEFAYYDAGFSAGKMDQTLHLILEKAKNNDFE